MTKFLVHLFIGDAEDTENSAVRLKYGNLASIVCILCNVLLFVGKFLVGTLFGSISIAADAVNNLSDASSNVISLVGFKLGSAPADEKHPYGHARYEYLAGLAVSVMILVIGIELFKESLDKVLHPTPVTFSWLAVAVLAVSIAVKLWMALFNRTLGKTIHSETLLATAADSRNDVVSTGAVLLASFIVRASGLAVIDGIMGLLVAAFILYSGFGLVRDTLSPLLGEAPDPTLVSHIEKTALSYPGVLGIHDLMVHDYGPGRQFATLHVELPAEGNVLESHDLIDNIERDFWLQDHLMVTIHYDPIVTADPHVAELREFVAAAAHEIDPALTVHDLRIVPGTSHTNVLFDCVTPPSFVPRQEEIRKRLFACVREAYPKHICVIKMETSYAGVIPEQDFIKESTHSKTGKEETS